MSVAAWAVARGALREPRSPGQRASTDGATAETPDSPRPSAWRHWLRTQFDKQLEGSTMRRAFEIGGIVAAVVMIAFGRGRDRDGRTAAAAQSTANLLAQKIVGTPDMTPAGITAEAKTAGLNVASLDDPELLGGERDGRQRLDRALLRAVHEDPRARGDRRPAATRRCRATRAPTGRAPTLPTAGDQGPERPAAR